MKFHHTIDERIATVHLAGEIDSAECNCLEAFWNCHLADDLAAVHLHCRDVDGIDGPSIAILVNLIRAQLAGETVVTLHDAPQMLAHTLYKIDLLNHPRLTLVNPRADEQHAT